MPRRPFILVLIFLLLVTGCSPSAGAAEGAPSPTYPASMTAATDIPKQNGLIFVEFFAGTWMDCRLMEPIVHGVKTKYSSCMTMERVNFHQHTPWHELLFPFGSPEFALLDSGEQIIHRWIGFTEEEEFAAVLDPLCNG